MEPWKPDYTKTPRRIVCAAARNKDHTVIISVRHFDAIMHRTIKDRQLNHPAEHWKHSEQGFVDQFGDFLTRKEAMGHSSSSQSDLSFGTESNARVVNSNGCRTIQ